MSSDKDKSLDLLGVKPIADAINTVTKGAVEGAGAFLGRICLPAAEEFGLLLKDKVSSWRENNAVTIVQKAEQKHQQNMIDPHFHAHPRLVMTAFESGSWSDNDSIQEMWAGLLASSCSQDGKDESNLLFMNLLSQLTTTEALILNHCCETVEIELSQGGWLGPKNRFTMELDELKELTGLDDIHRIDRELDHLRALELALSGFHPYSTQAEMAPTALGLHMYVRCQGYVGSPLDYFGLSEQNPKP
ncbi:MAG: Abi-alpha family protein [Methylococcaceae bacterium]